MKAKYKIYRCYWSQPVKLVEETNDGEYANRRAKQLSEQWKLHNVSYRVFKD